MLTMLRPVIPEVPSASDYWPLLEEVRKRHPKLAEALDGAVDDRLEGRYLDGLESGYEQGSDL
jgi:hypothetical protein